MPGGDVSVITPGYFRAMGIRIMTGRDFEDRDRAESPPVALLNETAARLYFPGEDPIGKRLRIEWSGPPEAEIVGVAADIRHGGLHWKPDPCLFLPNAQRPHLLAALVVRASGDPAALVAAVKEQIRAVDPEQGVSHVQSMEGVVADSIARPRLQTVLLGVFAGVALVLACVGIYGVISYSVAQRTREIGVRLALGAEPRSIVRLVFREGLGLTAAGAAFGLLGAIALTRTMTTLLYGVKPTDPAVFAAVVVLLAAVAAAACYFPARRATRVDPVVVLREE
jgi:putative ABC transport system permease protein